MLRTKHLANLVLATLVLVMMVNPATGVIQAYHGVVSDDRVSEGDEVRFSASFANYNDSTLYVYTMNVTFVEKLGVGATRDAARPNITKVYDSTRRAVAANGTFTDTMTSEIDFEPGAYNVSIFFAYATVQDIGPTTPVTTLYALSNATFVVEGQTGTVEFFRNLGFVILFLAIGVIGVLVYNAKFRN